MTGKFVDWSRKKKCVSGRLCVIVTDSLNLPMFKKEEFISTQGFRGFCFLFVGSLALGPAVRTTWWSKAKKEREAGPNLGFKMPRKLPPNFFLFGSKLPFKDTPLVT